MKKKDWLMIGGVLLLALLAFIASRVLAPKQPEATVTIYVGEKVYQTVPADDYQTITIDQGDGKVNTIHVTPTSMVMASSTCHNQLCVQQGVVTADNAEQRPLYNMIVCAPHRLVLELLTAQEAGHGE